MDMLQVFHMNKGQGEASYAQNCNVQKKIMSLAQSFVEEAIEEYLSKNGCPETMGIADLGCSSGPTALDAVFEIIIGVVNTSRHSPKFMVFLNDLPGNDFNGVFASISDFQDKLRKQKHDYDLGGCFIAGLPGSFYGKLLPPKTLHFVYSSSSLHWLSQVPEELNSQENPRLINKGKVYISMTSTFEVVNAYRQQYKKDFLAFLKSRAEEMISGGRMVLTLVGRKSRDPTTTSQEDAFPWEFIAQTLATMVSEGLIEEEKLDTFNVPYYAPCLEEIKELVEEESSFIGYRFEAVEVEWDGGSMNNNLSNNNNELIISNNNNNNNNNNNIIMPPTKGERIAKIHRAVAESMLQHHFGAQFMDPFFHRYSRVLDDYLTKNPNSTHISLVISLIKK